MLGALSRHLSMKWIVAIAVVLLLLSQYVLGFIKDTDVRARISVAAAVASTAVDLVAIMYCQSAKR